MTFESFCRNVDGHGSRLGQEAHHLDDDVASSFVDDDRLVESLCHIVASVDREVGEYVA